MAVGKAYSKYSGGRCCYIPIVWDTGCSKSIISEETVRGLGSHIEELERSLNIISTLGDTLPIIADIFIFITTQVTGPWKKLLQCCNLRGNKQSPEILVSLERIRTLRIIHETFGGQTIDEFLYNNGSNSNKYSERYNCNNIDYYQPPKSELKEPTKEEIPLIRKAIASKGRFIWTDEMQKEYEVVRETMLEQIQLTP